jgi:hypothetical protein
MTRVSALQPRVYPTKRFRLSTGLDSSQCLSCALHSAAPRVYPGCTLACEESQNHLAVLTKVVTTRTFGDFPGRMHLRILRDHRGFALLSSVV